MTWAQRLKRVLGIDIATYTHPLQNHGIVSANPANTRSASGWRGGGGWPGMPRSRTRSQAPGMLFGWRRGVVSGRLSFMSFLPR